MVCQCLSILTIPIESNRVSHSAYDMYPFYPRTQCMYVMHDCEVRHVTGLEENNGSFAEIRSQR